MITNITQIGLSNAQEAMEAFKDAGNNALLEVRNYVTSPHTIKKARAWGINDAAKLIGTTPPTLRKFEEDNGKFSKLQKSQGNRTLYTLEAINYYRHKMNKEFKRPKNTPPIITAVTNFKGGCAKTTTAIHLAQKCAILGIKTLLIDLDPQATSTFICGGIIPDVELEYEDTIADSLLADPNNFKKIIRKTSFDGLDIAPSNLALQDLELSLPNFAINNHEELGSPALRLKRTLKHIEDDYDVVIIDCGPNLGILTINAITASNAALIPIPPNMVDFASFVMLTRTLQTLLSATDSNFDFFRVLLTKHNNSQEAINVENMMRTIYGGYVLANSMCETVEIAKAASDISSIYEIMKPRGSRESYRRAMLYLDNVNNEIIELFKNIWKIKSETQVDNNV